MSPLKDKTLLQLVTGKEVREMCSHWPRRKPPPRVNYIHGGHMEKNCRQSPAAPGQQLEENGYIESHNYKEMNFAYKQWV